VDPSIVRFPDSEPRFNTETCFHAEVAGDARVRLDLEEHEAFRWVAPSEALALMKWEGAKAALRALAAQEAWTLDNAQAQA
jgi:8-oxo-dGTP pyrophosphatase MutT (NUDIX family)